MFRNDFQLCDFAYFIWNIEVWTGEGDAGFCQGFPPWLTSSSQRSAFCYHPCILIMFILLKTITKKYFLIICLTCGTPQEYHFIISSEASMWCDWEDDLLNTLPYPFEYFYGIEYIWHVQEGFRDDVVSKMICEFNGRQRLDEFNQNLMRDIFRGVEMRSWMI